MRNPIALSLLVGALASCSGVQSIVPDSNQVAKYALTVNLKSEDTPLMIEQRYGGHIEVWRADDGFAILGVNQLPTNDPAVRGADENVGSVAAPELQINAAPPLLTPEAMQSGGWTAWSGGWSAWGGGWTAWSGGTGSSLTPTENKTTWAKIGLPAAQSRATYLGSGVRIAVIDTGIDLNHPALKTRLVASADMRDFVDNDAIPQEVGVSGTDAAFGHGTGVAGIIAQIAPNAKIMPLRVLSPNGSGTETAVVNAINWAINHNAQIIQLSLGSTTDSAALGAMVASAANRGIYVVTSAGNTSTGSATFPGRYSSGAMDNLYGCSCQQYVLSVASVSSADERSPYSNYGIGVTMSAPGEKVYTPYPGNRLGYWSGTSFAAPMVSGAIALGFGQAPVLSQWSDGQMVNDVSMGADSTDLLNPLYKNNLGSGRLNIHKFLKRMGI